MCVQKEGCGDGVFCYQVENGEILSYAVEDYVLELGLRYWCAEKSFVARDSEIDFFHDLGEPAGEAL